MNIENVIISELINVSIKSCNFIDKCVIKFFICCL